jgi:hypothetical protein
MSTKHPCTPATPYSNALTAAVAGEQAQVIVMNNSIEAQIAEWKTLPTANCSWKNTK